MGCDLLLLINYNTKLEKGIDSIDVENKQKIYLPLWEHYNEDNTQCSSRRSRHLIV
jgi:hypothetical protein